MAVRSAKDTGISISIIIPVLNEAAHLKGKLEKLYTSIENNGSVEVIVCDGGSTDHSVDIARQFPCQIVSSRPGRAIQMNTASHTASGDWILFLHADTLLPDQWAQQLPDRHQWGFFPVKLSGNHWLFRIIEFLINFRSRYSQVATGDQALYFRRHFFSSLEGFPLIPIMEDIAISKLARKVDKPYIAENKVVTSSRRWEQNGITKTIILMWCLRLAYWSGVSPNRLHRIYYPK